MDGSAGWAVFIGWMVAICVWFCIILGGVIGVTTLLIVGIMQKNKWLYLIGPIFTVIGTCLLLVVSYFALDYFFNISLLGRIAN